MDDQQIAVMAEQFQGYIDQLDNKWRQQIFYTAFSPEGNLWHRFKEAPASTKYHGAEPGGLLNHSLLVTKQMLAQQEVMSHVGVHPDSLIVTGLCHDLGKIGNDKQALYLENSQRPSYYHNNKIEMEHEVLSLWHLQNNGIWITVEEMQAILYHNWAYRGSWKDVQNSITPLLFLLHTADHWVSWWGSEPRSNNDSL